MPGSSLSPALGRIEAIRYWDERHSTQAGLAAGGDIGLDEVENQAFYKQRLGILLSVLGGPGSAAAPPTVLDVGCGTGWFARELATCGYAVTGIDASEQALSNARAIAGTVDYVHAAIDEMWLGDLFDVVVSVDVLFHLTEDETFRRSLARMSAHLAPGGMMVVAERDISQRVVLGDYIIHRPQSEYSEVLGDECAHEGFVSYSFPGNPIGFHWYRKAVA